jgi:catechol 2,3-dioxygenase-like lactoylglutathione lyase family enzyme
LRPQDAFGVERRYLPDTNDSTEPHTVVRRLECIAGSLEVEWSAAGERQHRPHRHPCCRSRAQPRVLHRRLAPLGWAARPPESDPADGEEIGFGRSQGTQFAVHSPAPAPGQDTVTTGAHIAFLADDRESVHAFHAAALANGGRDIGAPGPRNVYSAGYYGAFVLDPDGNNIEAVWHDLDT